MSKGKNPFGVSLAEPTPALSIKVLHHASPLHLGEIHGSFTFFNQIHGTSRGFPLEKGDFLLKHDGRKVEC